MTHLLFGHGSVPASLPLQRRFAGRLVCVLIAAPITILAFLPVLLQAARM